MLGSRMDRLKRSPVLTDNFKRTEKEADTEGRLGRKEWNPGKESRTKEGREAREPVWYTAPTRSLPGTKVKPGQRRGRGPVGQDRDSWPLQLRPTLPLRLH